MPRRKLSYGAKTWISPLVGFTLQGMKRKIYKLLTRLYDFLPWDSRTLSYLRYEWFYPDEGL